MNEREGYKKRIEYLEAVIYELKNKIQDLEAYIDNLEREKEFLREQNLDLIERLEECKRELKNK